MRIFIIQVHDPVIHLEVDYWTKSSKLNWYFEGSLSLQVVNVKDSEFTVPYVN